MDRFANFEQFAAFLADKKVTHNIDRTTQIVELPVVAPPLPPQMFVKWERQLPIFTMIQFMIDKLPQDRIEDLEAATSRLNTVMEIGGFCIDYKGMRLFSRLTVPVYPDEGISAVAFQRTFELVAKNARGFIPLFQKVIDGANGREIEQIAREYAQSMKPATPPS